ncbi:MAG: ROK family protein, partial [Chloroflexota bacterium]|nr:ROK family protein [Chloroflexota bacterium]
SWPRLSSVGIGVPGLYDPAAGTTRFLVNVPGEWAGRPVAAPMAEALGLPGRLINDARAFGLAELRLGAGRGASSMVGLTLGTGVGGVIAIDGRVHQGHDGTAGEIGHQTIDPDGPLCGCGNRGCLEAFARADRIAAACGAASAGEAVQAARRGDQRALDGLSEVGRYLGIGIANVITLISPDRVVIGGGIAAAGELLLGPIRDELRRRVLTTSLDRVTLVTAELGTWAGAIGAAVHGAESAVGGAGASVQGAGPAREWSSTAQPSGAGAG